MAMRVCETNILVGRVFNFGAMLSTTDASVMCGLYDLISLSLSLSFFFFFFFFFFFLAIGRW